MRATCFSMYLGHSQACQYKTLMQEEAPRLHYIHMFSYMVFVYTSILWYNQFLAHLTFWHRSFTFKF